MVIHSFSRQLLQARLIARRLGAVNLVAALCWAIALSICLLGLPYLHERLRLQQIAIFEGRKALQAPLYPVSVTAPVRERDGLKAFYEVLGDAGYAEQQIKTIFALASDNGLALAQADYRMTEDKAGGFSTYRVSFPVKGSYGAVRLFCMQLLLAIPFASLDELRFKRAAISSEVIEVNLQLTLYLTKGAAASGGALAPAKDNGS